MASRWAGVSVAQLGRLLEVLAEGVTVTAPNGQLLFANAAALERMGLTLERALASSPAELLARFDITDEDGRAVDPESFPGRRVLRGEQPAPLLLRLVDRATGRRFWTLVKATEFEDDEGRPLAVNVLEDVTDAKEQERRERFVARASEVLASSLDYEQTLQQVTRFAVPGLADWCSVELLDGREIRQVAVAHVDPAKLAVAREFRARYPPRIDDPGGVGAVVRTGNPELYTSVPDEVLQSRAQDPEQVRLLRELEIRSVIVVPMRLRDLRVIGAISFVAAESAGQYDEDDLAFVEEFARHASSAVENALLYRERSETAEALQRSLIPAELPALTGWRIATRYRPASESPEVGGDFYDLFTTPDGFIALIGDVTGKGPAAAAITALARYSARTAAMLGCGPAAILDVLNGLLLQQPELSPVTAVVAQFTADAEGAWIRLACAGHPLPLRHRHGEPPAEIGRPGMLLGFDSSSSWSEHELRVEAEDTVLLYTDGVTDAIGTSERFGEERLQAVVADAPADPEAMLSAIGQAVERFASVEINDDMAMIALTRLGDPVGIGAGAASGRGWLPAD